MSNLLPLHFDISFAVADFSVNLLCGTVLDKIIVKSQKPGLLTINFQIQKFPSFVCKTESCKETFIAHIKRSIAMCFSSALRVTLRMANGDSRLVATQFCYFGNSSSSKGFLLLFTVQLKIILNALQ